MINLDIPLLPDVIGVDEFEEKLYFRIKREVEERNGAIKDMVAAVLDVHRTESDDLRGLRDRFSQMSLSVTTNAGREIFLSLGDVPSGVQGVDGDITIGQREFVSTIVRDVALTPNLKGNGDAEEVSKFVKRMVEKTGVLDTEPRIRTFVWGGHSVPQDEYSFARSVGYWDGYLGMEIITGCGQGVMKAPFKGASTGYNKQREVGRQRIGFNEQKLMVAEAPNPVINKLCVFPDIEKRMEAFIRASHRGRVHPGGTGAMEEIMTFLGMKMHPKNEGLYYPFDLVDRPGGAYVSRLEKFFRVCFGDTLSEYLTVFVSKPEEYAKHVRETNVPLQAKVEQGELWNEDLYMPPEIQKPYAVSFEALEKLDLNREREPFDLIVDLRRFFSAMVYLVVKNPQMVQDWKGEKPLIKGDWELLYAVNDLIDDFNREKRLRVDIGKTWERPYRVK